MLDYTINKMHNIFIKIHNINSIGFLNSILMCKMRNNDFASKFTLEYMEGANSTYVQNVKIILLTAKIVYYLIQFVISVLAFLKIKGVNVSVT